MNESGRAWLKRALRGALTGAVTGLLAGLLLVPLLPTGRLDWKVESVGDLVLFLSFATTLGALVGLLRAIFSDWRRRA